LRTSAVEALDRSLSEIDFRLSDADPPTLLLSDGRTLPLEIVPVAVLDEARALTVVRRTTQPSVVVADLVSGRAREILDEAGVGWLDRRGHLRLVAPGLLIDRDTAPLPRLTQSKSRPAAIRGAASTGVAAGQLIWGPGVGVRPLARTLGLSPAAVSQARSDLVESGLLDTGPDARQALFWLLSDSWHPDWLDLTVAPRTILDDLVAGGTRAAAALGAPIITTADYPVELYATDIASFERARLLASPQESGSGSHRVRARVAVAPTRLVTTPSVRSGAAIGGWSVTHPLFVGLDLASDPARGREALEGWEPLGWPRAW
jgi:hypothetical protein